MKLSSLFVLFFLLFAFIENLSPTRRSAEVQSKEPNLEKNRNEVLSLLEQRGEPKQIGINKLGQFSYLELLKTRQLASCIRKKELKVEMKA